MDHFERRLSLYNEIIIRRRESVANLAFLFSVSDKTIRRDIKYLKSLYLPIETDNDKAGGVYIREDYHPYKNRLTSKQLESLHVAVHCVPENHREGIVEIINEFGPYQKYG